MDEVNEEFRTPRILGKTIDSKGRWLPKQPPTDIEMLRRSELEEKAHLNIEEKRELAYLSTLAKDRRYANPEYEKLKQSNLPEDIALFEFLEICTQTQFKLRDEFRIIGGYNLWERKPKNIQWDTLIIKDSTGDSRDFIYKYVFSLIELCSPSIFSRHLSNPAALTDKGFSFELLLFSTIPIINWFYISSKKIDCFELKFHSALVEYALVNGINNRLQVDLVDFINERFKLYYMEMNYAAYEIRAKTAFNFYSTPLLINPISFKDIEKVVKMEIGIVEYHAKLIKGLERLF